MGKTAVVFPGQGAQVVGMGKDFYENFETAKKIIDEANTILGFDLKKMIFEGPEEELTQTQNTQPALVAVSTAILEVLKEKGLKYDGTAGHSLGEYSAYVAAGKMELADALKLVRKRGELMSQADPSGRGGMAAVMRMDDSKVEEICSAYENVVPANYNCPGQLVISGDKVELEKASEAIKAEKGRVMPLKVSGPFHSPLMKDAAEKFGLDLEKAEFKKTETPVYANVSASPVASGEEAKSLKEQIYSSVRWTQTIQNMIKDGYDSFIEVGSGKVLRGLIKKIDRSLNISGVNSVDELEKLEI